MAAGMVKAAISTILRNKDFNLKTPRMMIAREAAQKVLDAISADNQDARDTFTRFSMRLNEKIEALATPTSCKKFSTQKQRVWSGFHSARICELYTRSLWTDLYTSLSASSFLCFCVLYLSETFEASVCFKLWRKKTQ